MVGEKREGRKTEIRKSGVPGTPPPALLSGSCYSKVYLIPSWPPGQVR